MTDKTPTDAQQYLNVASQCAATATSELAKNVLVDDGSGTLRELLNDAADAIRAGWGQPAQAAEPVAVVVPCHTPSGKRVALYSAKQDLPIGTQLYTAHPPSPTPQAASVQEDAARYRWLREGNDAKHGAAWHVAVNLYGCEWDAAIDAALASQGGK